jgi:bifunctional non-homologous end joining protein LigD
MSPARILFPSTGFTVADAVRYYEKIAPLLLPHIRNRPMSFRRFPESVADESFWEKDAPSFTPRWVKRVQVKRRSGKPIHFIVIKDVRTLRWLAEIGGIELHPFTHTVTNLTRPTHVVFDLDPGPGATVLDCAEVALLLRSALDVYSLDSFVRTTGSKGLQLNVPLNTAATHAATESFAQLVAGELARAFPALITARMARNARARRVFIDYSQNADFKTNIAPWSLRGNRAVPLVATPLTWKELEAAVRKGSGLEFDPDTALKRAKRLGDPSALMLKTKQRLPAPFLRARTAKPAERDDDEPEVIVDGIRLPKPRSQSGRRLFVLPTTDQQGDELWLDVAGEFRRFILRPDRESAGSLVAVPAGKFRVAPEWFRGEVQKEYRDSVTIRDIGSYEVIEGSLASERLRIWFEGKTLAGEWTLEKIDPSPKHRSWRLRVLRTED